MIRIIQPTSRRTQCEEEKSNEVSSSSPPPDQKQWHNLVAGGVAGAGSRIATAPLDLIRIRRQLQATTVVYPSESMWQSWKKIVRSEGGVAALFRGNTAAISLWISYAAVQFAVYTPCRTAWKDIPGAAFGAGAVAGVCATLATYPFDVCRTTFAARGLQVEAANAAGTTTTTAANTIPTPTQMHAPPPMGRHSSMIEPAYPVRPRRAVPVKAQPPPPPPPPPPPSSTTTTMAQHPPRSMIQFAVQLWQARGIQGFYAGAGAAVAQIIPYMGLNFWLWDLLTTSPVTSMTPGTAGAISGAVSKLAIYPVDTIKRRLQARAFFEERRGADGIVTNHHRVWNTALEIYQQGGWKSFYRGVFPSLLKTTIATSLSFSLFKFSKNVLTGL